MSEATESAGATQRRVIEVLDQLGVPYEILECDPQLADTMVFCEHYGYSPDKSVNTLVIKAKTGGERYVVCVLLASTRLDVNRSVRKRLGVRRLSFASADETRRLTGMELGGVTPVALPEELPLWVDAGIMRRDYIILGGGSRSCKIRIAPEVFTRTANTEIVEGLAFPLSDQQ
jgi:prolyl-tRNA editing enzyme YbaK/EbsC (Cys-tRNA(Pro) deacylase)